MKNLKPILQACSFILLLTFASCRKDSVVKPGPDPVLNNTPVTAADLVDYNIPIQLSSDEGLRIIYFSKDGNDVKATFDAVNVRRIFTVNVVNNVWVMDLNGNGSTLYTFTFGRLDNGDVTLTDIGYKKQDDASVKINLLMLKNANIPAFTSKNFRAASGISLYLKFSNDHNFALSTTSNYAGAGWSSYYDLCPGAWKGTYNGVNYMGLTVKLNPNEDALMYVQKAGEAKSYTLAPL